GTHPANPGPAGCPHELGHHFQTCDAQTLLTQLGFGAQVRIEVLRPAPRIGGDAEAVAGRVEKTGGGGGHCFSFLCVVSIRMGPVRAWLAGSKAARPPAAHKVSEWCAKPPAPWWCEGLCAPAGA